MPDVAGTIDIAQTAKVCYEATRAYSQTLGENKKPWEEIEQSERDTYMNGVISRVNNLDATPEEQHEQWCMAKRLAGWTFGKTDTAAKTHDCLRPYHELPEKVRLKDALFLAIVKTMANAL